MRRAPSAARRTTTPTLSPQRLPGQPPEHSPRPATEVRGLTLTVTGRELGVRLGERVRWHRERADILIEQLGKLGDLERAVLERALHDHRERATYLTFVRDHIDPDVVYRLEPSDLRMIDLVPLRG